MKILYLSYTGLAEPLGVSQVLGYLVRLAYAHRITLITFEKAADRADAALMAARQASCDAAGIRWIPLTYHHRPRFLATAWDLLVFAFVGLREARRTKADVIHARSYIASYVAALLGALLRRPFIFDTRALWPEEMIAAGRLRRGSWLHRLIVWGEQACFRRAGGVVMLTQAAADRLRPRIPTATPVLVIPTCADVDRFRLPAAPPPARPLRIISVGSILSGWFRPDLLFAAFAAIRAREPDAELAIYSIEDAAAIRREAAALGHDLAGVEIAALAPEAVPPTLQRAHGIAMFFTGGDAKLGSCPTRMAEALASGLPVLCNGAIGDVGAIVRDNRVGTLLEQDDPTAAAAATDQFLALLRTPGIAAHCRDVAERLFSTESGVAAYDRLYTAIAARP